jgi:hypothetical protein
MMVHRGLLFILTLLANVSVLASSDLPDLIINQPYAETRAVLIAKGWSPIKNNDITASSLYAQEIYLQGMEEVIDCVSMELDACWFEFSHGEKRLQLKTITRQLRLDTFKRIN